LRSDLEELKTGEGPASGGGEAIEKPDSGVSPETSPLDQQMQSFMADAPFCDQCGHITVRNGACYKCMNCGNSMGCS
jgi:ribonucleoside-diphosphate reductase alpha chain